MPKGIKGFQKGQKFTPEHRAKLSAATTRNRTGKRHSEKTKEKLSEAKKGENNPMWKGGITLRIKGFGRVRHFVDGERLFL